MLEEVLGQAPAVLQNARAFVGELAESPGAARGTADRYGARVRVGRRAPREVLERDAWAVGGVPAAEGVVRGRSAGVYADASPACSGQ